MRTMSVTDLPFRAGGTAGSGSAPALPYPQLWRMHAVAWWRPLLMLAVLAAVFGLLMLGLQQLVERTPLRAIEPPLLGMLLIMNLAMLCLIPASLLAVRLCLWQPARRLWSVPGGLRWGLLWRCWLAGMPGMVVLVLADVLWVDPRGFRLEAAAGWLLAMTVFLTPLQCAGEELAFRGVLATALGRWIRPARAALLITLVVPSALFAWVHGAQDATMFAGRMLLGMAFGLLAWRAQGLEASIALHTLNNQAAFAGGIFTATLGTSLTATSLSPAMLAVQLGAAGLSAWLMVRFAMPPRQRGAAVRP